MTQDYVPPSPAENSKSCAPTWVIYGISLEGDEDDPFYIGITTDIGRRIREHNWGRGSAAYDRVQAYEALGWHCSMTPLATYQTKAEARAYEMALIAIHRGLVNRNVAACVRAFASFAEEENEMYSYKGSTPLRSPPREEVTPSRDRADIYDQQSAARARRYRERLKAKNAAKALAETVAADG